jgi:zinc protease
VLHIGSTVAVHAAARRDGGRVMAKFRVARVLALAAGLMALAHAAPDARAAVFNPETFMLPNGMQVVVIPNRRAPIVIHMVWYKVGAADEPRGKSGIAHFLEHLMFKGTKTVPPGEFSKIVARNGGQDNAFTTQDYTAYFQKVARDKLELVMRLESDRMRNLVLTDKVVLPERDVVLEERRSRTDNEPSSQLYEQTQTALFMHHPYRIPVIGWKHEIEKLTTKDAMDFYARFYAPNNAILIVAGDVNAAELKPLAEKYYGVIPRGPDITRDRTAEPMRYAAARLEMKSPRAGEPSWSRAYLAPSYRTATGNEAYALQVLSEIMGGGATSRLYRKLVEEEGVASSAGVWYGANDYDSSTFHISASPREGDRVDGVETAIDAEIALLLKDGVTEDEVKRAQNSMIASAVYARDSLRAAPNVIGRALTTGGTIADVESWPERIRAVTAAEVNAAAKMLFVAKNSVTSVLLPDGERRQRRGRRASGDGKS